MKTHFYSIRSLCVAAICFGVSLATVHAVPIIGRTDTFEDGTTQGWGGSYPGYTPHPITIASGGPAGPNDSYLEISTVGFHLATRNQSRAWSGDYLSVGVKAISMDLLQLTGTVNIRIQLAIFGPGGMFASATRTPSLNDQPDWTRHTFSLNAQDLVYVVSGSGRLEDTLRQVDKILIRHDNATPSRPGSHPPHVIASVGIDNITAVLRDYDVAWIFGNRETAAYRLDRIDPAHIALGVVDAENPPLALQIGKRYQVTVTNANLHPLEIIAKGSSAREDEVLLSLKPGTTGSFEDDERVEWQDLGTGTAAFTLTADLASALQGTTNQGPGYRCGIHSQTMRGDITLSE